MGWKRARLATKAGFLGAALLCLALLSIGLTLWIGWQLEGGAAAVNEAGRLRMQTWRLAHEGGTVASRKRLPELVADYDASLQLLVAGDPSRPLFLPRDAATQSAYRRVRDGWQQLKAASAGGVPAPTSTEAEALVRRIDVLVDAVEVRMAGWGALLSSVQLSLVGLAIAAFMIFLYASHLVVFAPVDRLRRGLQSLEQGALGARISEDSQDEFGELSRGFNRMAQRLETVYRGMEDEVRAKTTDLRLEQQRLAALYEATAFAARATSQRELAVGFADRMRRVASAEAVALRWMDPSQ